MVRHRLLIALLSNLPAPEGRFDAGPIDHFPLFTDF